MRIPEVYRRDRAELLLPSSVPDLQFVGFVALHQLFTEEHCADGRLCELLEVAVDVPTQDGRLSHTTVPEKHDLEGLIDRPRLS